MSYIVEAIEPFARAAITAFKMALWIAVIAVASCTVAVGAAIHYAVN